MRASACAGPQLPGRYSIGGIGLLIAVRALVERERPQVFRNPLEEPAATPSFPSERTFLATIVYLMVPLVLAARFPPKAKRSASAAPPVTRNSRPSSPTAAARPVSAPASAAA